MPCYNPLPATKLPGGGKPIIHKRAKERKPTPNHLGIDIKLPCNQCIGCRIDRCKQWAVRLLNEAQLHEKKSFITLTYNDKTLLARRQEREPTVPCTPPSKSATSKAVVYYHDTHAEPRAHEDSLRIRDVQLFMKRLRFELTTRNPSTTVRYYLVGEYGDKYGRPHYHIALYGEDFADDRTERRTSGAYTCYRSSRLEKLWPHGNSEIGELTLESTLYVAGYIMKKITGKKADQHYQRESRDGTIYWITPEFALMSRRPGLGRPWLEKYMPDVYPHDYVVINGQKKRPPRYYDKLLEMFEPKTLEQLRIKRQALALTLAEDNTPRRLADKEAVATAKMQTKKHQLE